MLPLGGGETRRAIDRSPGFLAFKAVAHDRARRISVGVTGRTVVVSAPAQFNLVRLLYLGSEKSAEQDDIGQYGEGFKAAAVALLRDFRVTPYVVSGTRLLRLSIAPNPVDGTALYPIQYEFGTHDGDAAGSHLVLLNCTPALVKAMKEGLNHFFWPGHPILGKLESTSKKLDIYKANGSTGACFYLGLKRCDMQGMPLVFVYKTAIKKLDTKIGQDRDRKAFDDKIADTFYSAVATELNEDEIDLVLAASKATWSRGKGHPLLAQLAKQLLRYSGYDDVFIPELGPSFDSGRFFADIDNKWLLHENPALLSVHQEFIAQKRVALPPYFVAFGFDSVHTVHRARQEERIEIAKQIHHARPTPAEHAAIVFLLEAAATFHKPLVNMLISSRVSYLIGDSEELLGEMRRSRGYMSTEVMLHRMLFVGTFGEALGTLLHEAAHMFGFDGDRAFTDALTDLLVRVINSHELVGDLNRRWEAVRATVIAERDGRPLNLKERLQVLPPADLLQLLASLPEDMVRSALDETAPPAARDGGDEADSGDNAARFVPPAAMAQ